jgi:tRNA threonylcarbamoyladenosine biosynthesis protein TsaB
MIILTIRTDQPQAELGLFKGDDKRAYSAWQAHRQLAETINDRIKELLEAQSKTLADLQGIVVFEGPGSFTGLRIGVSVANALAYGLDIPIVGQGGADWIEQGQRRLMAGQSDESVAPRYGSQPNITQPKH